MSPLAAGADRETIAGRLATVQRAILEACRRAGRDPAAVTLVCVTKTVAAERIREAYAAGARDFGENYAQELRDKAEALADLRGLRWHFIGTLQRNKARVAVGRVVLIHSAASRALLEELDRRASQLPGQTQDLLIELNLAGEESKSGAPAEALPELLDACSALPHLRCVGLMTMPPFFDEPERARPFFSRLRELGARERERARPRVALEHLSMGMSGDFEAAIEEGATLIRVGTAIFGARG
jgi:pyridoxal phosphate enzyme (YggS family)